MSDDMMLDRLSLPDVKRFTSGLKDLAPSDGAGEKRFFRPGEEVLVSRSPGRLDLMGGNDDYTGGLVFEATIREAVMVAVQARSDRKVIFFNPAVRRLGWEEKIEFSLDDLREGSKLRPVAWVRAWCEADARRSWCAYILGDLYYLMKEFPDKVETGFNLYLESDIPLGKGVSSSAAIEVAPMKAMAALYGVETHGVDLALWTQWVEIALTGAACGVMDQLAVVMGGENVFIPMLCQPCLPQAPARLPSNLRVWGIDSGVRHAVTGIEYEAARAATFMGYRYLCEMEGLKPKLDESGIVSRYVDPLWNGYLANLSPALFREKYESRLPLKVMGADFNSKFPLHLDPHTKVRDAVNYPVLGATRYAVEENWRVNLFYKLITANPRSVDEGVARLLGELMYQAHVGYTDSGLASAATDLIVSLVRAEEKNGLLGAKITGGGAGGTVAILGYDSPSAAEAFARVTVKYQKESGLEHYVFDGSSPGADDFGVARMHL
ncbi:MAG TPA: galactokinase family protein [Rectinemataceae bacterium]|nr:galactokinase family protein [Rectinemataceae bacterium]